MRRSYKYRIYPTTVQREALDGMFEFCRLLYNSSLQERISFYKKYSRGLSYNSQSAQLPEIRELFQEETVNLYSQSIQAVLKQLDGAYQNFFRRVKQKSDSAGFPRFKQFGRFKSILFPQSDSQLGGIKLLSNSRVKIYGLGEVKIKLHRPFLGRCKTAQIKKEADRYFLILSCDDVPKNILPATEKITAYDLGLTSFLTADDGTKFHHPRPWRTAREKLAEKSRKLALKQRGSLNRKRARSALQRAHQKVADVRRDFQHKLANQLIKKNDVIILEDLNIQEILKKKGQRRNLNTGISDAAWGNFVALLLYKAESAGREVVFVNPRNTSKMCSGCGEIKIDLTLFDRTFRCGHCGMEKDRDHNAALNIRRLGTNLAVV